MIGGDNSSFAFAQLAPPNDTSDLSNWKQVIDSGETIRTPLGPSTLFSARPYEPAGWLGIGTVILFGVCVFLPVASSVFLHHVFTHIVYPKIGTTSSHWQVFVISWRELCKLGRRSVDNVVHLRHRRKEDIKTLGPEAALFLALYREAALLLLLLTLFGCTVLLPIHLGVGRSHVENDFSRSSVQHLAKHDPALWVHTIFIFFVTYLVLRFIWEARNHLEWAWLSGVANASRGTDIWDGTVFVTGINQSLCERDLCKVLTSLYPGELQGVAMVLDPSVALKIQRERIALEKRIQLVHIHLERYGTTAGLQGTCACCLGIQYHHLWERLRRFCVSCCSCSGRPNHRGKARGNPPTSRPEEDGPTGETQGDTPYDQDSHPTNGISNNNPPHADHLPRDSPDHLPRDSPDHLPHNYRPREPADDQLIRTLELQLTRLKEQEAALTPESTPSAGKAFITFATREQSDAFASPANRQARVDQRVQELQSVESVLGGSASLARRPSSSSITSFDTGIARASSLFLDESAGVRDADLQVFDDACSVVDEELGNNTVVEEARALQTEILTLDLPTWNVKPSRDPHDIIWGSLHLDPAMYYLRSFFVNLLVLATLVLLTTPVSLVIFISRVTNQQQNQALVTSFADFVDDIRAFSPSLGDFMFSFVPQLVLVFVNSLLLSAIYFLTKYWEPHHTHSGEEISILRKSFWFLIFNTLILPSLAFRSMGAFFTDIVTNETNPFTMLGRVFIVSSGAFTLCYIITQTWVGGSFELLRMPEKLYRCVRGSLLCRPFSSRAERRQSRAMRFPFDFGSEYATMLTMLSLCILFSTMVPVILPFGLCYFCVKSLIVEYHLYYKCGREKVHKTPRPRVGRVAIRYFFIPLLLYQASAIGFFSGYVCVPGQVLPWNGAWGTTSDVSTPRSSDSVVLDPETQMMIKPCVTDSGVPGTISTRGDVYQLFLLFTLCIGTTVYAAVYYIHEPNFDALRATHSASLGRFESSAAEESDELLGDAASEQVFDGKENIRSCPVPQQEGDEKGG